MWGDEISYSGGYIYFDNSLNVNKGYIQLCARQSSWTGVSTLSQVGHTKLYYVKDPTGSGWGGILGWVVISDASEKSSSNFDNWTSYGWCTDWNTYGFNSGSTYLIVPSSTDKQKSVTTSYHSTGYAAFNHAQTVYKYTSTDGGSTYSAASINSGTVTISAYKLTAHGTSSNTDNSATINSASSTSANKDAAYTGEVTLTASANTGYTFVGWFESTSAVAAISTNATYTYNAPNATKNVYARFKENRYSVTVNNDGNGTTTPSGAQSNVGQVAGLAITAEAAENYEFANWEIVSGTGSFESATTTASNKFFPTSDATIRANFYSTATISLTVSAGSNVTTVTGSEDPVTLDTKYDIAATAFATGYEFANWTATPAANAVFDDASAASTKVTVKNGSVVVTANAQEKKSALTASNHYDAGNPAYAAPTVGTASIGIATTSTLTAVEAEDGYFFAGWELSENVVVVSGDPETDLSITVRTNGEGEAATAVANYEEDLTSVWHLVGENATGSAIFPHGWTIDGISMMPKKTGHSTEPAVYVELEVSVIKTYEFKIVDNTGGSAKWYGYSTGGTYLTWTKTDTKNVYTGDGNGNNLKFTPTIAGTYEFKVDYSGAYPAVTITYPEAYNLAWNVNGGDALTGDYTKGLTAPGATITKPNDPTRTGYTFAGWAESAEGAVVEVPATMPAAAKTYYAKWTINTYTIKFMNGEEILQSTQVEYGVLPAYTGATPTKETTAEFTYTFKGWDADIVAVTGDATYNATFTATKRSYTITWLNDDDSQIDQTVVEYGEVPVHGVPTKAADDQYTYSFDTWDPAVVAVTGDATYKAVYTSTAKTYAVTLHSNEGTINAGNIESYTYGIGATLPTNVTKTGYNFGGWYDNVGLEGDPVTAIADDATGTKEFWAKWTIATYTVTLNLNGGSNYGANIENYTYGVGATLPIHVTKWANRFDGWYDNVGLEGDPIAEITTTDFGNKTYWAKWTSIQNEMSASARPEFKLLEEGDIVVVSITEAEANSGAKIVLYGRTSWDVTHQKSISAPGKYVFELTAAQAQDFHAGIILTGYNFTSDGVQVFYRKNAWDKGIDGRTALAEADLEKALFYGLIAGDFLGVEVAAFKEGVTEWEYQIQAGDDPLITNSTLNATGICYHELSAEQVTDLQDPAKSIKIGSASVLASKLYTYTANKYYTITWLDDDDSLIDKTEVAYGEVPVHGVPTKAADDQYTYSFDTWNPAVVAVTGDATYKAVYTSTVRKYDVTIAAGANGSVNVASLTDVPYGTAVATNDNKLTIGETVVVAMPAAQTDEYTYAFVEWTDAPATITGATTITATFSATKRSYTITFMNGESELQSGLVEYGVLPAYTGATPTKEATAEFTYTFKGWDADIVAVTGEATYNATFTATKRSYTITWLNDDDSQIDQTVVEYGEVPVHGVPTKEATAQYTYAFDTWSPTVVAVTGDATYKAVYTSTVRKYTVTIVNDSVGYGTVSATEIANVLYGTLFVIENETPNVLNIGELATITATPVESTSKYKYEFKGWVGVPTSVESDVTIHVGFIRTDLSPATALDDVNEGGMKVEKFMRDNKIYIRVNGRVYDASGRLVE